ncbi:MAG: polysaccharide deacetylase family protein [Emcibacteraceae bacterium]|uniref:polysaccharide deacetylase family protein n=1 Tax=Pseudemcibacter sp. TaxID=2943293 RepID=UPI00230E1CCE|nr:polysaccharide deacetylase family protein [Emcibacteraceae bacterium]MDG1726280.1 polysaccharide deacetylase family protein [Emcibacteraceae bacterium]
MKKIYSIFFLLIVYFTISAEVSLAQQEDSAVIIMYHRFGENNFPTTNVTLDQIDQHISELIKDEYNVIPLRDVIKAFKERRELPERTIAITIDDGFLSVYEEAWPRFKKAGIPITVFISTESVDDQYETSMTWDQIRELDNEELVEIGHHGHAHAHMPELSLEDAIKDIDIADEIFQTELGYIPDMFAYPYGEYSPELRESLEDRNYLATFAQFSSTATSSRGLKEIPRFAFNENYADMNRFKLIINSRALKVKDILPRSPNLTTNPPVIGFTVESNVSNLASIGCFPSHINGAAKVTLLGETRIEIRFDEPFPQGRSRVNCTMPGPDNRWYWFGMPFFNLNN